MTGTPGDAVSRDAMARELAEGPGAVSGTLAEVRRLEPELTAAVSAAARIVLVGTGASLAAIRAAAPLWRRQSASGAARATVDPPPTITVRQSAEAVLGNLDGEGWRSSDLVIAVSQSGASPETLVAARRARTAGATVLAITAHEESPLAAAAPLVLTLATGVESDASTKSALATLAALLAIGAVIASDPEAVDAAVDRLRAIAADPTWAAAPGSALARSRFVWLVGFGAGLGVAEAGALLWHEKVVRPAVAATPSEFRHGLIEAVREGDSVVLVEVDDPDPIRAAYLARLRSELRALRVRCVEIARDEPVSRTGSASRPEAGAASRTGVRALEALLRVQALAHATARAAATYRDGFRVLRNVVEPAIELVDEA